MKPSVSLPCPLPGTDDVPDQSLVSIDLTVACVISLFPKRQSTDVMARRTLIRIIDNIAILLTEKLEGLLYSAHRRDLGRKR